MEKKPYEDVCAYVCAPADRGSKTTDYYISEGHHICWDFARKNRMRCVFIKEYNADAGMPVNKREYLGRLLKERPANKRFWNKLIVPSPEWLSASPSEFLALLKALRDQRIEVIFVEEPELSFWPDFAITFSTNRIYRSELKMQTPRVCEGHCCCHH